MKSRYAKIAVLCFCVAAVSLSAFFAVNETQARVFNTMSWKNVYLPYSEKQESNYLTEEGTTVIVEDWIINASIESSRSEIITITAPKKINGKLTCSSSSDCLIPLLDETELIVDEKGCDAELLLKLGYPALSLQEEITVYVDVKWIPDDDELPELKATFVVVLRPKDVQISTEDAVGLTSNYLDRNGHTIVLEDWVMNSLSYRTKDISFSLDAGEVSGVLECVSDSGLIKAELDTAEITVTDIGYIAKLTLTPNASALEITEETTVTVRINWKETPKEDSEGNIINADAPPIMWADIKIKLIPNNTEPVLVDVSDTAEDSPAELEGIEADILSAENTSFIWTEFAKINVSAANGAQHVYITYNGGSFPEGASYCIDENNYYLIDDYIYVPVFDSYPEEIFIDFSGTNMKAPEKIYITAKAENAGITYVDTLELSPGYELKETEIFDADNIPEKVASNKETVIYITAPKGADTLELFYGGGKFPVGTSYFVDSNEPVTLGDEAIISVPVFSEERLTVTFDFTRADMTDITDISLDVKAYNCGVEFATDSFSSEIYEETVDSLFDVESCPETFAKEEYLTLDLTAPLDSETMEFRFNGGAFPKGTKYSINSDEFVTLAGDVTLKHSVQPGEKIRLTLDFSQVELITVQIPDTENTGIIISASAYIGNRKIEEGSVATSPTRKALTADFNAAKMIIAKSGSLSLPITGSDEKMEIIVERLVIKDGVTERVTADDSFGIEITVAADENSETLTISNAAQSAAAGSYRITLLRDHNGVELRRIEIPLFIYY